MNEQKTFSRTALVILILAIGVFFLRDLIL